MSLNSKLPKIKMLRVKTFLLFILFSLVFFAGGYYSGYQGYTASFKNINEVVISRGKPADKEDVDFTLFWKVWDSVAENYYDKTKLQASELVYGAIKGMVAAVGDPYTVFLPPDDNKIVQEDLQGTFEGIGIQIGYIGKQLAVIAPLPGTPAEKAGIKAGDLIIAIKDENKGLDTATDGMSLPDAIQAIRGPAGSKVSLAIMRDQKDEAFVVEVVRDDIKVASVMLEILEDGKTAHIRVLKFVAETEDEWDDAVTKVLKEKDVENIVLDVRNNPGGYLQGAVDLAGDFVDSGTLVVIEEKSNGEKYEFKTQRLPRLSKYKMVILINKGSASASEIFAGALSEQKGVKTVGAISFGKGTIQEPRQINGGSGLHITVAKWLTPKGNWINESGIVPDFEVEDNPETEDVDEQLLKALEILESN